MHLRMELVDFCIHDFTPDTMINIQRTKKNICMNTRN